MKKQNLHKLFLLFLMSFIGGWTLYGQVILSVSMSTTPACSLDGSATATVTGGTPPYSYSWYGPTGSLTTTTNTLTGVPGGTYYLYVTDAGNGWGSQSFAIGMPFQPTLTHTNDICNGGVGTATVSVTGGTGPFSYLWSNGQTSQTATGLVAGTYEITITDAVGCFVSSQMDSSLYAYIGNSSPVNVTMTNTSTTCTNGSATVSNVTGGTAPYTYVWNTTPPQFTATASGLTFGGYMCTVTDATGCTDIGYTYVNQLPNGLSATTTHADEFCLQANGSASVTVFGGVAPYSYQWSNGATTQSITGLSYGSYQVTVTDANGCPKHQSVYISRLDPISLSLSGTPPSCGNTGGAVSVNVLGGTAPYTYLWNNGATTSSISGLSAGFYSVRVEDANGCSDHNYYQLTLPNNCYALVSGSVTGDQNANCINDGGDFPMGNKIINVGNNWAVTNHLGDYQAYALPGSVTIEQANI
ncbi:MAG TPA: SprB repeat-containing protein, partial [Bacteroidia bacterium]|nr:SprB repeat-containing protein [Bacteroidia bacterium]